MSGRAVAKSSGGTSVQQRIAVRKWLARHGPWHGELPPGVDRPALGVELRRLLKLGILDVWSWECEGHCFELNVLPDESSLVTDRVYRAGPYWSTYVNGWNR